MAEILAMHPIDDGAGDSKRDHGQEQEAFSTPALMSASELLSIRAWVWVKTTMRTRKAT